MLKVVRAETRTFIRDATEEDGLFRRAFGRFARPTKQEKKNAKVETDKLRKDYFWLECDCREENGRYPVLFCVQNRGIRRDPNSVQHTLECDFHFYPKQQVELVKTYKKPGPRQIRRSFNLLKDFGVGEELHYRSGRRTSRGEPRSEIAMLLFSLLGSAQLDLIGPEEGPYWDLQEQIARLAEAAAQLRISDRALGNWIAFDANEYEVLKGKIAEADRNGTGQRHYGLYLFRLVAAEGKTLSRCDGGPLTVFGHMATFGEAAPRDRYPYLVAAVVASPSHGHEPRLVRAYVHPCQQEFRWTLVDSNLERNTLDQLLKVRYRLRQQHGFQLHIRKPLFDMGPEDDTPREVCIPDFLLTPDRPEHQRNCVIVETMGGYDDAYEDRKERMHEMFRQIGQPDGRAGTEIEEYEPPEDQTIEQYQAGFRTRVSNHVVRVRQC